MQAVNHAVFGSLVAVLIKEPAVAIPVALASHFALDMIPHYGEDPRAPRGSKSYNVRVVTDAFVTVLVILLFVSLHPPNSMLLVVCASVAVLPDLLWPLALYIKHQGPLWAFFKFHKRIQRESRSGLFVEIGWFIITGLIVVYKIR